MIKKTIIVAVLVCVCVTTVNALESVTFRGKSTNESGAPLTLTGLLTKPQGDGPFPAVVLLHACAGLYSEWSKKHCARWAERFAQWGYITLLVDSHGPRGESNICDSPLSIAPYTRAQDAHDAKSYLAGLSFVDPNRIAVMGWATGGTTALFSISERTPIQERGDPFRAAVTLYPWCNIMLDDLDAPLLILIGEKDDWCLPVLCSELLPEGKTAQEIIFKVYPGVHHCFDIEGMDQTFSDHRMLYHPEATADAHDRIRDFLAKHMK